MVVKLDRTYVQASWTTELVMESHCFLIYPRELSHGNPGVTTRTPQ
jgi:hypothetical protein